MEFIKLFATALITSFIMDMIWLGVIAKQLYENNIGFLLRKTNGSLSPIWPSALLVYLAIVLGIIFFVVPKANGNAGAALLWGAVFGAITYGIYDFTNYAIIANWPLKITIIDFIWGMILCGITSLITVSLVK
jgi:uncharacterized membrane protein